jgi:hypothetical protein
MGFCRHEQPGFVDTPRWANDKTPLTWKGGTALPGHFPRYCSRFPTLLHPPSPDITRDFPCVA